MSGFSQSQRLLDEQPPQLHLIPRKAVPSRSTTRVPTPESRSNVSHVVRDERKSDPPSLRSSHRKRPSFARWWTLELVASLLSLVTFAIIVVVLNHYDGRPQRDWPYNHLTINSLIALLSTINRAALVLPIAAGLSQGKWLWFSPRKRGVASARSLADLDVFDNASRSVWGSFQLLRRIRPRHIVSLGALLMILALGFDTFSQQTLSIEFRDVIDTIPSGAGNVPRSELYANLLDMGSRSFRAADLSMKGAISNGWMSQNITDLHVQCSNGNCTWPTIPTLGMCGQCSDVTTTLSRNCSSNTEWCSYLLPSGNNLTSEPYPQLQTVFQSFNAPGSVYSSSSSISDSSLQPSTSFYAAHFEAIRVPWQALI